MPGLINSKTLIPPFSFGRNVKEDDWDKMFPNGVRKSWESEEEYQDRKNCRGKYAKVTIIDEFAEYSDTEKKLSDMGVGVDKLLHEATYKNAINYGKL